MQPRMIIHFRVKYFPPLQYSRSTSLSSSCLFLSKYNLFLHKPTNGSSILLFTPIHNSKIRSQIPLIYFNKIHFRKRYINRFNFWCVLGLIFFITLWVVVVVVVCINEAYRTLFRYNIPNHLVLGIRLFNSLNKFFSIILLLVKQVIMHRAG